MQTVLKLHTLKLIIQNVHVFFWHSCRSGFKTGEQNGAREKSCSPQPMSDIEQCRQFHPRGQISFQTSSAHGRQLGVLNHQRQHNLQLPSALLPPSLFPPSPSPFHFLHLSTPLSLPQNPLMNLHCKLFNSWAKIKTTDSVYCRHFSHSVYHLPVLH